MSGVFMAVLPHLFLLSDFAGLMHVPLPLASLNHLFPASTVHAFDLFMPWDRSVSSCLLRRGEGSWAIPCVGRA